MGATSMYPLDPDERAAVKRVLDEDTLDRLFLDIVIEHGPVTRASLQDAVNEQPKLSAAVPRWLASARRRGLLERTSSNHSFEWLATQHGVEQRNRLAHEASPEGPRAQRQSTGH